jgi:hypothetical protein
MTILNTFLTISASPFLCEMEAFVLSKTSPYHRISKHTGKHSVENAGIFSFLHIGFVKLFQNTCILGLKAHEIPSLYYINFLNITLLRSVHFVHVVPENITVDVVASANSV